MDKLFFLGVNYTVKKRLVMFIVLSTLLVGCGADTPSETPAITETIPIITEAPQTTTTTEFTPETTTTEQPEPFTLLVRESSQALFIDGLNTEYDAGVINRDIAKTPYVNHDEFSSGFAIEWLSDETTFGYKIDDMRSNIFVSDGTGIIDPAFMIGVPIIETTFPEIRYTLYDIQAEADTLAFPTDLEDGYYAVGGDFSYICKETGAREILFSIEKIISSDYILDKIFERARASSGAKEAELTETYTALVNNLDKINTEDCAGIVLIDLDFDEIPELLVSRAAALEYDDTYATWSIALDPTIPTKLVCNVDVYRIAGEELRYIDTIYNNNKLVYENGNTIGLKETADGDKQWFVTSYRNFRLGIISDTDYLVKLSGDELIYTEIFAQHEENYYHMEEEMIIEEVMIESPYEPTPGVLDWTSYEWDGITAKFGRWELFGFARRRYAEDITVCYNLYSDWLVSGYDAYDQPPEKKAMTPRMMEFRLMYLVDSYYYGAYDPQSFTKSYSFLGDYAKPVIYLYPESTMDIDVKVEIENGELTTTWPKYNDGWSVSASPDGTLTSRDDGYEYSYLYWEGRGEQSWDLSEGFVVKREDTGEFLREKLAYMGLTAREYNEFIVYWLPLMEENAYNLIAFQTTAYEEMARLVVSPAPDSVLRIFMTYLPLDEYIEIPEQKLRTFKRFGFSVIEWGGARLAQ